jgi:hypothetical protein
MGTDRPPTDRQPVLADFHSRVVVHDGLQWWVWPSAVDDTDECRPPKAISDPGPSRLFFHAHTGEFFAMPYADASWSDLAAIPESRLRAWLAELKR